MSTVVLQRGLTWFRRKWALILLAGSLLPLGQAFAETATTRALADEIDAAFQAYFLATEFDAAEAKLLELIQSCDASCARADLARAWMYVGVVRSSGKQDAEGAKEAFLQALVLDPGVTLDTKVANPETAILFERVREEGASATAATAPSEPAEPRDEEALRAEAKQAGLVCGPVVKDLQTRRPLPLWCQSDDRFWRVTLRYLAFNADGWVSRRMNRVGARYEGEIPCDATELAGPLKYFVTVTDREGALVANLGSLKEPITLHVAENVAAAPPSLPERPPPERCPVRETCPPEFPGCEDGPEPLARGDAELGAECQDSLECKAGLMCEAGRCVTSPRCDIDEDCTSGVCRNWRCEPTAPKPPPARPPSSWFGLHFGADFGPMNGSNVCSTQNTEFDCFTEQSGAPYPPALSEEIAVAPGEPGDPYPGAAVGGWASGSLRVLLSYDRRLSPSLALGGRLGVAFNGGPSRVGEPEFLPLHLEARASYWLFGSDSDSDSSMVRPFFFAGGGFAQVDLRKDLVVQDCSTQENRRAFEDCVNAEGDFANSSSGLPEVRVTATRKLGRGFITAGVGAFIPLFKNMGVVPAVGALFMFPEAGFVMQPSLGMMAAY